MIHSDSNQEIFVFKELHVIFGSNKYLEFLADILDVFVRTQ